jgi:hypothetical protein
MPVPLNLKQLFTNNAVSLLTAPITATSTSLTVMTGYGALYPNPGPNEYFLVTLENQTASVREIIKVTGRVGDTFTFTLADRGQEGTTALPWAASSGNDTLVDHRVTAETMDRAMALPVTAPGTAGVAVEDHGIPVPPDALTLDFIGNVSVTGSGSTKTINIGALTHEIHGQSGTPISIDPGWTIPGNVTTYSETQRGFKFFVTLTMPANHVSCTFEVLGNISGNLSANAETVTFNRSARVGFNFNGSVNIALNTALKQASLTWTNNETNPVVIQCIRIQHNP